MAEQDIVQNMIRALGQSQRQRFAEALGIHHADIDEYSTADLLQCVKKFAAHVNYYKNDVATPAGDWSAFFPYPDDAAAIANWLAQRDAATTPHLALLIAFLKLYKEPQSLLNQLTGRHLNFYYRDVLRLAPQPAQPDRAHLVLELKKNAAAVTVDASNVFSAGKDATGVELLYTPVRETVINQAQVASIRSLYMDDGIVRYAPVANSADGLGGELDAEDPQWPGFGTSALPAADTGFALASPVLRMQEGTRGITVTLMLADADGLASASLESSFQIYLTGEKNWLGPYSVEPEFDSGTLQFTVSLEAGDPAVIDYDPAVHGLSYTTQDPLLYVRLCTDGDAAGYSSFANVRLLSARIEVDVQGVTSLQLENDTGTLNPQKAFMPFGTQPAKGSRFLVGYDEAFSKKLAKVELSLQWKEAPTSFSSHYQAYNAGVSGNAYFTASAVFADAGAWNLLQPAQALFETADATVSHKLSFTNPAAPATATTATPASGGASDEEWLYALNLLGTTWAAQSVDQFVLHNPVHASSARNTALPEAQAEKLVLTLDKDFLHAAYRKKFVENVMAFSKSTTATTISLLNEPYTPAVQSLSLSYRAYTDLVAIDSTEAADFANLDLQFFHVGYSGQMREHGYPRNQFDFLVDKSVYLLPQYAAQGELLIGIRNVAAGDSVSLLFQVAEGSADPDLDAADITWSALCDNYWKTLGSDEYALDTTNRLRSSGIVKIVNPREATTTSTVLPADCIWLKAAVAGDVQAVCQLVEIAANAVEVEFTDQGNDPAHLSSALEAGKIAKLKNGSANIKSVRQSYASFGGRTEEKEAAFHIRAAERLRHKDRGQTAWDYERIVLQAFPAVHKVKCIPHARPDDWLAPGHVMLVVVPDLSNRNTMNPLRPKVDSNTLSSIAETLQKRCGMQVTLHVRNPSYQKVKLDFKVKFKTGYEFNYYRTQLNEAMLEYLSPWAFAQDDTSAADIRFGGSLYKSVLLNVVEEFEYVDFVTDFKLYSYMDENEVLMDVNEVQARTPDAILVSESEHVISEY